MQSRWGECISRLILKVRLAILKVQSIHPPHIIEFTPLKPSLKMGKPYFVGLAYYQGKDIVFRFIIEYIVASFRDFYRPLG